jgi:hypothetical protein
VNNNITTTKTGLLFWPVQPDGNPSLLQFFAKKRDKQAIFRPDFLARNMPVAAVQSPIRLLSMLTRWITAVQMRRLG